MTISVCDYPVTWPYHVFTPMSHDHITCLPPCHMTITWLPPCHMTISRDYPHVTWPYHVIIPTSHHVIVLLSPYHMIILHYTLLTLRMTHECICPSCPPDQTINLNDPQWTDINIVTGCLKLFLRELPDSVVPMRTFMSFIEAASKGAWIMETITRQSIIIVN